MDRGHAKAFVKAPQLGAQLHPQLGVQVGERLVEQKGAWVANDRPPHRHPLPLTAGKLLRLAFEKLVEVENSRRLVDPLSDLVLAELPHA